jgi:hypothetical protein
VHGHVWPTRSDSRGNTLLSRAEATFKYGSSGASDAVVARYVDRKEARHPRGVQRGTTEVVVVVARRLAREQHDSISDNRSRLDRACASSVQEEVVNDPRQRPAERV